MYLKINDTHYPCGRPSLSTPEVRYPDVEGLELPIDNIIMLCRDDGFIMRMDDPADYERVEYENNTLLLSNLPIPEPVEPPEPPEPQPDVMAFMAGFMEGYAE